MRGWFGIIVLVLIGYAVGARYPSVIPFVGA